MLYMIDSTTNTTPSKSTKSQQHTQIPRCKFKSDQNSIWIYTTPKFQFEFIPHQNFNLNLYHNKFLGAHSNQTKISISIYTTPYLPRNVTYFFFLDSVDIRNENTTGHQGIQAIFSFFLIPQDIKESGLFFLCFWYHKISRIWAIFVFFF